MAKKVVVIQLLLFFNQFYKYFLLITIQFSLNTNYNYKLLLHLIQI
ncbi:hypothetical protein FEM21_29100 [Flavobacterium seoulense]|uniref:Uncharacterized protein n=1 Tax=Flavobacterium seoulense TaxID=1492738 RepID=A0A066WIZ6_9FLAO|nr:hypothetical protein FEM21_29100 [Flavobacterium seoulense]